jgi:hypothetical protein
MTKENEVDKGKRKRPAKEAADNAKGAMDDKTARRVDNTPDNTPVDKQEQAGDRCRPWLALKWKPGQSGNPSGRPKGSGLLGTLRKTIEKTCPADKKKRTWKELVVMATIQHAIKGNPAALREVWERLEGKLTQPINHRGTITSERTERTLIAVLESNPEARKYFHDLATAALCESADSADMRICAPEEQD